MSGPYGYGGYGGYGPPQQGGYSFPPRPGFPPAGQPPRQGVPPGQPPPTGYAARPQYPPGPPPTGYQGYQQAPGYGMPGYRPPSTQPQGYTPATGANTGYTPQLPPSVSAGTVPTVHSGAPPPPMYNRPAGRPAPPPPAATNSRPFLPMVPDSFPELHSMSTEELESLMDNVAAQAEYFEGREDIKRLQSDRQKVVERNEELATTNLSLKPQLEEKQEQLIELYAELEAKRNELSDLQQQQQALADHYAPQNILARLKIAACEVEEESEAISDNFLNGGIAIDEFLKTYIPKKTLCHSRRAKEEKMEKMGI